MWLEDAVQEIKIRIWRLGDRALTVRNPATFAKVVARAAVVDFMRAHCRKRGKQAATVVTFTDVAVEWSSHVEGGDAAPFWDPAELRQSSLQVEAGGDAAAESGVLDLQLALRRLSELEVDVIRLYAHGFDLAEIAEQLRFPHEVELDTAEVQELLRGAIARVRELSGRPFDIGAD